MSKYYVTTAIPYVNAAPHIGHALEFLQGDTIARYHKLLGQEVMFLSGGDENALKNVQAAEVVGKAVQEFVDENTAVFLDLAKKLNVEYDIFQKGSDAKIHFPSSQKLWELCAKAGDIYSKTYKGPYCVGCETFYDKDELNENGECFEHPGKELEVVEEENYFFKLSKYEKQLIELISNDKLKILPQTRKNEVLGFLKQGLKDISISRSNERAKNWGVPVPGDDSQRIYVWFDALNIYQSGIGFGWDEKSYSKWWPADIHVIGKGIIRFHAVYWIAFLLSAGLKLPKEIFAHGYITVEGQKMSKTIGNVVDPFELIKKYGVDPLRYYLLREIPSYSDGDFSSSRFQELYNADLANGLGNLVARVSTLAAKAKLSISDIELKLYPEVERYLKVYRFDQALEFIWNDKITSLDKKIDKRKPWKLEGDKLSNSLMDIILEIKIIAYNLKPFLPSTANTIIKQLSGTITKGGVLFPRLE
ncbi:methionine--tRNA ligase [Candidatus Roizmanbacteria bacterium CG22_combo_CG10-13_8_21_14_all_38_20]|uniref:Methionine--tRNA ligase n=1 Tax=Candidatus Roizmanbacteria bacterium CG22_combo_CG10-13_8_21_14_all_38_20 TaxID=1974862 RepID=A0A2H0BWP2_9BACT|nr:methionine--tRNA ligase [Candidatus Microgenomates bacterium]PIP62097.1 MAG: methionine--tRNA ligase [Candidatus Roizmanbacteria bacterium CG22_combo_CG10-13_8_21_14_all_38_20]PJC31823.1 MAG: methionine--tRNA ligase [Candidatus Roizmanbacteria bacterium CG_4_9_14_0_2_um_filter_38_17]